ncbi:hypothetical protein BDK51DRAFT_27400 [Blyttiomyces helicus]|uniref:Uncharacterized protein n=1 Tax=Blyttiomyces helicus TaxID=388810 RepID=A0A4P9W8V8_9FUNG|nr:hypothetical protein BDK51DRAFT_27400 [Blyttiomyces helicus]|eukprot:RKO88572.1 hypothetical protein BDK51DRAFT_27400 [Blyttiomyces helicus]
MHAKKAVQIRLFRQMKNDLRDMQDKARRLAHWLSSDGKQAFERERDKSNILMTRAVQRIEKLQAIDDRIAAKIQLKQVKAENSRDQLSAMKTETRRLEDVRDSLISELERLRSEADVEEKFLDMKKEKRDEVLLKRLMAEEAIRAYEMGILLAAAKRQNPKHPVDLDELELLDVQNMGLTKIPNLKMAQNIRFVNMDNNLLTNVNGLEELAQLRNLSLSGNKYEKLNMGMFPQLRSLRVAHNFISEFDNMEKCEYLQYLDASDNPLETLEFLSPVSTIQVLLLRNTTVTDMSTIELLAQLIYLDLSDNRLHNELLDSLGECKLLQHLDISTNMFTVMPSISNLMLHSLNLQNNLISKLEITTWLPMLRVLDLSSNKISCIKPLNMCPFLKHLYMKNNFLSSMESIFAMSPCQELETLDLLHNPVTESRHFHNAVFVLFPNIKWLNQQDFKEFTPAGRVKRLQALSSPIKRVHYGRAALAHLLPVVEDSSNYTRIFIDSAKGIAAFMGPDYIPYLEYLGAPLNSLQTADERTLTSLQEYRISWLTGTIQKNLLEMEDLSAHDIVHGVIQLGEIALLAIIEEMKTQVLTASVTHVQSKWRMVLARRRQIKENGVARVIQAAWRAYCVRKAEHQMLQATKEAAATVIQAYWRAYKVWAANRVKEPEPEVEPEPEEPPPPPPVEIEGNPANSKPTHPPDEADEEMEEFLATTNEIPFDDEMTKYLGSEALIHFDSELISPDKLNYDRSRARSPQKSLSLAVSQEAFLSTEEMSEIQAPDVHDDLSNLLKSVTNSSTNVEMDLKRQLSAAGIDSTPVFEEPRPVEPIQNLLPIKEAMPPTKPTQEELDELEVLKMSEKAAHRNSDSWKILSERTKALLARKNARYAKQEQKAQTRKLMKNPMERLKAFHSLRSHQAGTAGTVASSISKVDGRASSRGSDHGSETGSGTTVDIKPSHVAEEYSWEAKKPLDPIPRSPNSISPKVHTSNGVTLLINNYMAAKLHSASQAKPSGLRTEEFGHLANPALREHQQASKALKGFQDPITQPYATDATQYDPLFHSRPDGQIYQYPAHAHNNPRIDSYLQTKPLSLTYSHGHQADHHIPHAHYNASSAVHPSFVVENHLLVHPPVPPIWTDPPPAPAYDVGIPSHLHPDTNSKGAQAENVKYLGPYLPLPEIHPLRTSDAMDARRLK